MTVSAYTGKTGDDLVPIGTVIAWSLEIPPSNWLLCNGSLVQRDAYPELYNIITGNGSEFPFGADETSATGELYFRLPDMRNRFARTPSVSGNNSNVGAAGGSPAFSHPHNYQSALTISSQPSGGGHNHTAVNTGTSGVNSNGLAVGSNASATGGQNAPRGGTGNAKTMVFGSHSHNTSSWNAGLGGHGLHYHGVNGSNTTSDGSHSHSVALSQDSNLSGSNEHMAPYFEANYVIFAGLNRFYDWWVVGHSSFPTTVAT